MRRQRSNITKAIKIPYPSNQDLIAEAMAKVLSNEGKQVRQQRSFVAEGTIPATKSCLAKMTTSLS